jgi:hypothetical protein
MESAGYPNCRRFQEDWLVELKKIGKESSASLPGKFDTRK